MNQPVQPANEAELEVFLKAAEARFTELGIDPAVAAQAFDSYLGKQAEALNIQAPAAEPVEKQASDEENLQLAVFVKSAVDRFAELGVPEADAIAYLDAKMAQPQPSEKVVKIANHLSALIKEGQQSPSLMQRGQQAVGRAASGALDVANETAQAVRDIPGTMATNIDSQRRMGIPDYFRAHAGMSTAPTAPGAPPTALSRGVGLAARAASPIAGAAHAVGQRVLGR